VIAEATLLLGERPLAPDDVVAVARGRPVALGNAARARMEAAHALLLELLAAGEPVYGLTTGVGALKTVPVERAEQGEFQRLLLRSHLMGHGGEVAPDEFVRAAMVVRAAGLAAGASGVRPAVADAFCRALDAGLSPRVHLLGSVGQADLSQMAQIGIALVEDGLALGPREAHAIVNSNAFSVGTSCLAHALATRAVRALDLAAALSMEALVGNVDAIHPAVGAVRPHPGAVATIARLRALLHGGALLRGERPPRFLQDPLAFKVIPQAHGAARQALGHCDEALRVELASSGDSPIMLLEERRAISTGNHDIAPVAIALDYARLGLGQAVTISGERVQKLLTAGFSGLSTGLRADPTAPAEGLAEIGNAAASLAGEARLLAQPVSLELPTSAIAEGVEGRITMAPTAARRLHEMAGLALRLAALELECAAQAIDLRGRAAELGAGTRRVYDELRRTVPFVGPGQAGSLDRDPLTDWLSTGEVP
jgi:histidine ammonia-lyase